MCIFWKSSDKITATLGADPHWPPVTGGSDPCVVTPTKLLQHFVKVLNAFCYAWKRTNVTSADVLHLLLRLFSVQTLQLC